MNANQTDRRSAVRAVLWDVDGTLLDSAAYHWQSWQSTLALEGFPIQWEQFAASFGQRNDAVLRGYFGADFPLSEVERIAEAKETRYRELMREGGVTLLPGVGQWLQRLHQEGWRQAIASSAPRLNVITIVEALGIGQYFEAIVSAEDVQRGKPDPQVFLVAAQKLGIPPERCVVVEDAPVGIEAGRRAGMRTIGVLSTHGQLDGEVVVRTLDELPDNAFVQLLDATAP